jgi:hypothetical protein
MLIRLFTLVLLCAHSALSGQLLSVFVYNYAVYERDTLAKARDETAFIMQTAGVVLAWHICTVDDPCESTTTVLGVRILLRPMAPADLSADALGLSVVDRETGFSTYAYIYRPSVRRLASDFHVAESQVLGTAIAHELGHVLMGRAHSQRGIMRAVWTKQEMQMMLMRRLRFTRREGGELRAAVAARRQYFERAMEVARTVK